MSKTSYRINSLLPTAASRQQPHGDLYHLSANHLDYHAHHHHHHPVAPTEPQEHDEQNDAEEAAECNDEVVDLVIGMNSIDRIKLQEIESERYIQALDEDVEHVYIGKPSPTPFNQISRTPMTSPIPVHLDPASASPSSSTYDDKNSWCVGLPGIPVAALPPSMREYPLLEQLMGWSRDKGNDPLEQLNTYYPEELNNKYRNVYESVIKLIPDQIKSSYPDCLANPEAYLEHTKKMASKISDKNQFESHLREFLDTRSHARDKLGPLAWQQTLVDEYKQEMNFHLDMADFCLQSWQIATDWLAQYQKYCPGNNNAAGAIELSSRSTTSTAISTITPIITSTSSDTDRASLSTLMDPPHNPPASTSSTSTTSTTVTPTTSAEASELSATLGAAAPSEAVALPPAVEVPETAEAGCVPLIATMRGPSSLVSPSSPSLSSASSLSLSSLSPSCTSSNDQSVNQSHSPVSTIVQKDAKQKRKRRRGEVIPPTTIKRSNNNDAAQSTDSNTLRLCRHSCHCKRPTCDPRGKHETFDQDRVAQLRKERKQSLVSEHNRKYPNSPIDINNSILSFVDHQTVVRKGSLSEHEYNIKNPNLRPEAKDKSLHPNCNDQCQWKKAQRQQQQQQWGRDTFSSFTIESIRVNELQRSFEADQIFSPEEKDDVHLIFSQYRHHREFLEGIENESEANIVNRATSYKDIRKREKELHKEKLSSEGIEDKPNIVAKGRKKQANKRKLSTESIVDVTMIATPAASTRAQL